MGLLLLFPASLGPATAGVNLQALLGELWTPLNSTGPADAMFWTETDLYQWFDEAKNRLARTCGGFVRRDTSASIVSAQSAYSLPADHASTLQVDVAGGTLRPRTIQQLEALDDSWPTTAGTPAAFVQAVPGQPQLTVYPVPGVGDAGKTIGVVEHSIPAAIALANALLAVPVPVREYFRFRTLGDARAKESPAQMQDTAQWFRGIAGMLEKAIIGYYGAAE